MKKIQTLWMLVCLLLVTSAAIARDLKLGMSGDDVKQWQVFLQRRNFDLPADGYFGPVTKRATLIFQKKWKLYADGVVGPQTIRRAKNLGYGSTSAIGTSRGSMPTTMRRPSKRKYSAEDIRQMRAGLQAQRRNMIDLLAKRDASRARYGDAYPKESYDWMIANVQAVIDSYERDLAEATGGRG